MSKHGPRRSRHSEQGEPSMANALTDVLATYLSLDQQYTKLRKACTSDKQREDLGVQYATAQQNYQTCLNKELSDDDDEIADLSAKLKAANIQVQNAADHLDKISQVIDQITAAVSFGSKLVEKL